jgi:hypothetical protein
MNDAVIFRSDKFSLEPPLSERGVRYDLPLGDDLAEFVVGGIRSTHPAVQFSPVVREDFGSVVDVTLDGRTYYLTVTWIADCEHEDRWAIQFSHPVGFWGSLFGRRPHSESCRDAQKIVAELLRKHPDVFRDVEWLSQDQFDKRV